MEISKNNLRKLQKSLVDSASSFPRSDRLSFNGLSLPVKMNTFVELQTVSNEVPITIQVVILAAAGA